MKKYILSFLILCGTLSADCANNGDDTVTCQDTGLMWQDDANASNGNSNKNWYEALAYCENLTLANHNDWRLPNITELKSISNTNHINPNLEPAFRQNIQKNYNNKYFPYYWSSTTYADNTGEAFMLHIENGNSFHTSKHNNEFSFWLGEYHGMAYYRLFVRCVR